MIDYRDEDGYRCAVVRTCGYRMAQIMARELKGEIVGHGVATFPVGQDDDNDGEEFSC